MALQEILIMILLTLPFSLYGYSLSKSTKHNMIFGIEMSHELEKPETVKRVRISYLLMFFMGQFCIWLIWLGFAQLTGKFMTWFVMILFLNVIQLYATFFYGHTVCIEFKYVPIETLDEGFYQLDKEDIVIKRKMEYRNLIRQEFGISYLVAILTTVATAIYYPIMPNMMMLPRVFDASDAVYVEKSIEVVGYLILIQWFVIILLRIVTGYVSHKTRYINPAFHMLDKRDRAVRMFVGTMSMMTFFASLLLMYLQFSKLRLMPFARSVDVIVYSLITVCVMTLFFYFLLRINVSENRIQDYKLSHYDLIEDHHWYGGVIYINKNDNRLGVKNSLPFGRSVNLGTVKGRSYYLVTRLTVFLLGLGYTIVMWSIEK